jgi:hypothetical protein
LARLIEGQRVCKRRDSPAFYRRIRPNGDPIDDVEASGSTIEDKAAAPLRDFIVGKPVTVARQYKQAGTEIVRRDRLGDRKIRTLGQ